MALSDELVGFVKEALARGHSRSQVEEALKLAGWNTEQVSRGLAAFAAIDFPIPVPRPKPSVSAREAFAYLLLFTTLYIVAYNLASLLFDLINRRFPDPVSSMPENYVLDAIRWSIASLVVGLPVFLYMFRLTGRAIDADPNARTSPIRKWLTYLTLFIASCVLIGDVVTLIYNFLGGELTIRFSLKVLVVAVIAGTVFWYYLLSLRLDESEAKA